MLYACEDSAKEVSLGFDVDPAASETPEGKQLDQLSMDAWVPANRDRGIEVELEGYVATAREIALLRVTRVLSVTSRENPATPAR